MKPMGLAHLATHGTWKPSKHHLIINDALEDVAFERTDRLIINISPQVGKSTLISHYFPAWFLGRFPDKRVLLTSYNAEMARSWSRKVRDTFTEYGKIFNHRLTVRTDVNRADAWDIVMHAGMYSAGVGGSITGRSAYLAIIDDPIKNQEEANSPGHREKIWEWYQSALKTRIVNGAIIIVATRWHDDDLPGRLLKEEGRIEDGGRWRHIRIPAIADSEDDPLGRSIGEGLWPERSPLSWWEEVRKSTPPRIWEALYQNNPSPDQGVTFQREWLENFYDDDPLEIRKDCIQVVQAWDTSFKTGVSSDYSACVTIGIHKNRYLLLDVYRARLEYPQLYAAVEAQYKKHSPNLVLIENAASGQSLIQQLRQQSMLPIVPVNPQGSKVARAEAITTLFASGRVLLPSRAPWLSSYISELMRFPKDAHDDQVDATVYALTRLRTSGGEAIKLTWL